jgi:hypothetical protein
MIIGDAYLNFHISALAVFAEDRGVPSLHVSSHGYGSQVPKASHSRS